MSIQSLGDDVLLKVLSICDVYTALSVSMVNKYLREIALAKQLWLWLVCDLVRRGILDNPPAEDLDGYSTGQLIGEVRRVVAGPSSWSPGSSSSPTVDRRLSFATHLAAIYRTRLLPGGRYLALQTRKQVHIYGVAAGRCIWQHAAGYRDTAWAVDMIEVGIMARVLLLPRGLSGRPDISVHEVDLASGRSHEVFNLDLHTIDYGFDRMASILGDFFVVVRDDPRMRVFLLVNWRLCTYVFLGYEGWQYSSVRLQSSSQTTSLFHMRRVHLRTNRSWPSPHLSPWNLTGMDSRVLTQILPYSRTIFHVPFKSG
ncbi:hypothetical protein FB451DRAFT_1228168 [Mycena latifolia]|nr:hypothetical protein FB451DRAFT_1228168 [Mycena latifolia]